MYLQLSLTLHVQEKINRENNNSFYFACKLNECSSWFCGYLMDYIWVIKLETRWNDSESAQYGSTDILQEKHMCNQ